MAGKAEKYFPPILRPITRNGGRVRKVKDGPPGQNDGGGPDYSVTPFIISVEVKNTDEDGTLTDAPTTEQRRVLDKYGGFVFLMLWDTGYPNLPKGADAFLVPWEEYKEWWDSKPKGKSYRRKPTVRGISVPDDWRRFYYLRWTNHGDESYYDVPLLNPFWARWIEKVDKLYMLFGDYNKLKHTLGLDFIDTDEVKHE